MLTSQSASPAPLLRSALASTQFAPHIDTSLARGIRRSYFKALTREWDRFEAARTRAKGRNMSLLRLVESEKQLRERYQQMEKMMGKLGRGGMKGMMPGMR